MDKLTLEHLAPYLPYGLKVSHNDYTAPLFVMGIHDDGGRIRHEDETDNEPDFSLAVCYKEQHKYRAHGYFYIQSKYKPILRPLSDLTKEIEHKGESFVPIDRINDWFTLTYEGEGMFSDEYTSLFGAEWLPHAIVKKMQEWMFDLDSLIAAGLAVDINTLEGGVDGN